MAQVSVIIPVYNCEKYLCKCVDSVLAQTYEDFELILVDDGSTDASGKICDVYKERDVRVSVIHKENGGGAGEARNYGLSKATSPFVCFIDSDDWVEPNLLETMVRTQWEKDYDVVICGYRNIVSMDNTDSNTEIFYDKGCYISERQVRRFFMSKYPEGMVGYPWNKLYRKSIIDQNKIVFPKMRRLEDGIFNVEYFEHVNKCGVIPDILCNYRISQQVEKRKLPVDFFNLMEIFVLHYYRKLKAWELPRIETERPMVFYFLNDFVCCIENIYFNKSEITHTERKKLLENLQEKKLVKYMIQKEREVPRYSRVILRLFEKRRYGLLGIIIRAKMFLKTKLNKVFQRVKQVAN